MALIKVSPNHFTIEGVPFQKGGYSFLITASNRLEIITQITKEVVFRVDHFNEITDEKGNEYNSKDVVKAFLELAMFNNSNDKIQHAIIDIFKNNNIITKESFSTILKYGQNTDVDTEDFETILNLQGDHEIYLPANQNGIDTISSDNPADMSFVAIEGLTEVNGVKHTFTQFATLNGQNKVVLQTPLNRVDRIYNASDTELLGNVYVYEDTAINNGAPSDNSKVHVLISEGDQQSRKAALSTDSSTFVLVSALQCSVNRGASPNVDFSLQLRPKGNVFRDFIAFTNSNRNSSPLYFDPYLIIPPDADARAVAVSNASNASVTCWMSAYKLDVVHKF